MSKITDWLIHKLGGYTDYEHDRMVNIADKKMHEYKTITSRIRKCKVSTTVAMGTPANMSIEIIKRDMCRKMASILFEENMVEIITMFDEREDSTLYRGTLVVLEPVVEETRHEFIIAEPPQLKPKYYCDTCGAQYDNKVELCEKCGSVDIEQCPF